MVDPADRDDRDTGAGGRGGDAGRRFSVQGLLVERALSGDDKVRAVQAGASLVAVGTAAMQDPRLPERLVRDLGRWCDRHGVARLGDVVGVVGKPAKSRRGEPSLAVDELVVLARNRSPLPDTFHGLTDVETRYRKRYLDLLMNEDSRELFQRRRPPACRREHAQTCRNRIGAAKNQDATRPSWRRRAACGFHFRLRQSIPDNDASASISACVPARPCPCACRAAAAGPG